jgi:alpha-galactosidase
MHILANGYVQTVYYGTKIGDNFDIAAFAEQEGTGQGTAIAIDNGKNRMFVDNVCIENATLGRGDYRESATIVRDHRDNIVCEFLFDSCSLVDDFTLPDLPSAQGKNSTLALAFVDKPRKLRQTVYFSDYLDTDVITKSVKLENLSEATVYIERVMSCQLDLPTSNYILDTLDGAWARERYIESSKLKTGITVIDSKRGISSNSHNPYIVLREEGTFDSGACIGFNLIYSGQHKETIEKTPLGKVRVLSGINDFNFRWHLAAGESFMTPEATLCFSKNGTNGLTQQYHRFVNNNIVRGVWAKRARPILINNWEATYFNFTEKKLTDLAKKAKACGIELFVLDDGWFGNRTNDTRGLGDWQVNTKRLPQGLAGLAKKINDIGLDFGLWVEPEMVNPDSELYRAHPEWAITHPDYRALQCRNQLVLDFSNDEVVEYIISAMTKVLGSANISYVKWDFNRPLSEFYSEKLQNKQGEFSHRYILGFYRLVKTLVERFPNILFESCASGGNRVDLGILCYMPQFWTSDNTDSFDRIKIQEGTLTCYPQSTMGCHVSASPNHQTLRFSHIDNRFNTASVGVLGYELDLTELSRTDIAAVKQQVEFYKKYRQTLQFGTYFRTNSIFSDGKAGWCVVREDKKQAVAGVFNGVQQTIPSEEILRTRGLDDAAMYSFKTRQQHYSIKQFGSLVNMISPIAIKNEGKLQEFLDNNVGLLKSEVQELTLSGDILNNAGVKLCMQWSSTGLDGTVRMMGDFGGRLYGIDEI